MLNHVKRTSMRLNLSNIKKRDTINQVCCLAQNRRSPSISSGFLSWQQRKGKKADRAINDHFISLSFSSSKKKSGNKIVRNFYCRDIFAVTSIVTWKVSRLLFPFILCQSLGVYPFHKILQVLVRLATFFDIGYGYFLSLEALALKFVSPRSFSTLFFISPFAMFPLSFLSNFNPTFQTSQM